MELGWQIESDLLSLRRHYLATRKIEGKGPAATVPVPEDGDAEDETPFVRMQEMLNAFR